MGLVQQNLEYHIEVMERNKTITVKALERDPEAKASLEYLLRTYTRISLKLQEALINWDAMNNKEEMERIYEQLSH